MEPSGDLVLALQAAERASKIALEGFGRVEGIRQKEGKGLVTEVDESVEHAIKEILMQGSSYSILGEETGLTERGSGPYWVVDPLDGTANFSRGIPLFAVSIALMRANEILLGVVVHPPSGEMFVAEKGRGAYLNGEIIHVSETSELKNSIVFVNHGYAQEDRKRFAKTTKNLVSAASLRKLGTTTLELCYVAQGHVDAFLSSGDELWDYAAGILLVQEAGGMVTDWKMQPWKNADSFVLASNGRIHESLGRAIRK